MTVVRATDGVRLHVEVVEIDGTGPTVVYSHGFTAAHGEFLLQREALSGRVRQVFYDQRGHGRSDVGHHSHNTMEQLGRDLQSVLDATCPSGPVVLVGHSMGGMAVMAWARTHEDEVGTRVVGAFLLATSAGDLVTTGPLGRAVAALTRLRLLAVGLWLLRLLAPLVTRARRPGAKAGFRWTKHYLFGRGDDGDDDLVLLVQTMLEATPFTVAAAFYPAFLSHDESAALPVLARIPTTVLCGTSDRLTPISHSRAMAQLLQADLIEVTDCGHSVNVTRPNLVNDALLALVERSVREQAA